MLKTRYRAAFALLVLLCASGCYRNAPEEDKILGTWEFTGIDATGRVVFRRDHKVVHLFPEQDSSTNARWIPLAAGTWRLEGNEIVTDVKTLPLRGVDSPTQRTTRMMVREFHEDRLVREEGRSPFFRVRLVAERYAEILALLYVVASLIALTASIYAILRSSFRNEFVLFGIAVLVALAYSLMLLAAESAQTGNLIISPGALDSLKLPREILKLVWILIVTIAFVRFAFALKMKRRTVAPN
jgi:hypothetical protein